MGFLAVVLFSCFLIFPVYADETVLVTETAVEQSIVNVPVQKNDVPPPPDAAYVGGEGTASTPAPEPMETISPERQKLLDEAKAYIEQFIGKEKTEISFEATSVQPKETRTIRLFKKGDKTRIELSLFEGTFKALSKAVVINDGKTAYVYMPDYNIAKKGNLESKETVKSLKHIDNTKYVLGDMATFNGYPCRMLVSEELNSEVCFSEEFALPIFSKTGTGQISLSNISTAPLSDKLFEIPATVLVF